MLIGRFVGDFLPQSDPRPRQLVPIDKVPIPKKTKSIFMQGPSPTKKNKLLEKTPALPHQNLQPLSSFEQKQRQVGNIQSTSGNTQYVLGNIQST